MFRGKMYPSSRDGTRAATASKKDFLNPYQREELKKRLIEKYTKLFALNNPAMVREEVENFFRQNNEINTQNLLTLEQRIKSQSLKGRSLSNAPNRPPMATNLEIAGNSIGQQATYDYQGHKPQSALPAGHLHDSERIGASTLRHPQSASHLGAHNKDCCMPPIGTSTLDATKLSQMQDITYANEEEEWGTVYKYNLYLYKQEEKLKKVREQEKRKAVKQQLDDQLKEKDRRGKVQKEKEQSYINAQKAMSASENAQEEAKKRLLDEKVKFEKEMRDMQMKDIKERRDFETQQEKALDAYLLQKIKEEMKKEQDDAAETKAKKMNEMKRVMAENEERKRVLAIQAEKDRLQEVELQKKALQLAKELEEARAAEFKAKADRISNILKNSEDKVNDIKRKNLEMDMRNQRYQELREKALKEKERRETEEAAKRKTQLKTFLDRQVDEKKQKELDEKKRSDEQAVVWKTEAEQFNQYAAVKNEKKKATMDQYKTELKGQMVQREEKEREMASLSKFSSPRNDRKRSGHEQTAVQQDQRPQSRRQIPSGPQEAGAFDRNCPVT